MSGLAVVDHLVYFVPDLAGGQDHFERRFGVRPVFGGQHVGLGTHNALISMGDSYIELIAADPAQPEPSGARPFGIDELDEAALVTFAARPAPGHTLDEVLAASIAAGHDPGDAVAMSRVRPDGVELRWTLTFPTGRCGGAIPFFIDWGDTPNPAASAPGGLDLVGLGANASSLALAEPILDALGIAMTQSSSGLEAQLESAQGPTLLV